MIEGFVDPAIIQSFERMASEHFRQQNLTLNELTNRRDLFKGSDTDPDPRTNVYKECGLPKTENITVELLQNLYERSSIAARVVELWPRESWQQWPEIYEDEDEDNITLFEQVLQSLSRGMDYETNYYESQEGNPIFEALVRADIMAGIGRYGVIFLGTDDVNDITISQELPDSVYPSRQLRYLTVLPESQATIAALDNNPSSPRYGLPTHYNLTFSNNNDSTLSIRGESQQRVGQTNQVHHSRIIHICDGTSSNKFIGVSRQVPVLNHLLALEKLYPGSARMYWYNASPGISLETHPQLGGDVMINRTKVRNQMEQYMTGLQKYLMLSGMSAKTLAPNVTDPTTYIQVQIEGITIKLAVPMRIFMGSERGELASTQDADSWADRLGERNRNYTTPRIVVPFINRLINKGILPQPTKFYCEWPDLKVKNHSEEVDNNSKRVASFVTYLEGPMSQVVSPMDYLTRYDTFTKEEAKQILENGQQYIAEQAALQEVEETEEQPIDPNLPQEVEQDTNIPVPQGDSTGMGNTDEQIETEGEEVY